MSAALAASMTDLSWSAGGAAEDIDAASVDAIWKAANRPVQVRQPCGRVRVRSLLTTRASVAGARTAGRPATSANAAYPCTGAAARDRSARLQACRKTVSTSRGLHRTFWVNRFLLFRTVCVLTIMRHETSPLPGSDQRGPDPEVPPQSEGRPAAGRRTLRDLSPRDWLTRAVFALAGLFLLLSALFVFAPHAGAELYGREAQDSSGLFYVRAIGLRDAALALYLVGVVIAGSRRALTAVALGTLTIPAGDLLLLANSEEARWPHYLLHIASLLCFALLAWWASRPTAPR